MSVCFPGWNNGSQLSDSHQSCLCGHCYSRSQIRVKTIAWVVWCMLVVSAHSSVHSNVFFRRLSSLELCGCSWFLIKGQCLPPYATAVAPRAALFFLENLRAVKKKNVEVRKCVCWLELLYQSQEASLPGGRNNSSLASRKGTFLHPALLGCRTITKWLTHTPWPLAWIFVVCAHTDLFAAGCTSSSKPRNIFSWPFTFFVPWPWPRASRKLHRWK